MYLKKKIGSATFRQMLIAIVIPMILFFFSNSFLGYNPFYHMFPKDYLKMTSTQLKRGNYAKLDITNGIIKYLNVIDEKENTIEYGYAALTKNLRGQNILVPFNVDAADTKMVEYCEKIVKEEKDGSKEKITIKGTPYSFSSTGKSNWRNFVNEINKSDVPLSKVTSFTLVTGKVGNLTKIVAIGLFGLFVLLLIAYLILLLLCFTDRSLKPIIKFSEEQGVSMERIESDFDEADKISGTTWLGQEYIYYPKFLPGIDIQKISDVAMAYPANLGKIKNVMMYMKDGKKISFSMSKYKQCEEFVAKLADKNHDMVVATWSEMSAFLKKNRKMDPLEIVRIFKDR